MAEIRNTPEQTQDPVSDPVPEARRQAHAWLKRFPGAEDMECPICHTHDWGIADVGLLSVRVDPNEATFGGGEIVERRAYPLVPVTCETCGYTYFINEKWVRAGGTPPGLEKDATQ
jgi:hypothetical protein